MDVERDAFDRIDDILRLDDIIREIEDANAEYEADEPGEEDEEPYDPIKWGWVGRDGLP